MIAFDVDGVMTDGGIFFVGEDQEALRFNVQDGMGVTLAHAAGLETAVITGRRSIPARRRAEQLGVKEIRQGFFWKGEALDLLVEERQIQECEIAYLGDDILDIPVLERVGMPIAVANARPEVKDVAVYVTTAAGGDGALREAVEWLLELRGQKETVIERFARPTE